MPEQFSDEEKTHLSYLGSMLHVDPSREEEEAQKAFDAVDKAREQGKLPPTHNPSAP
jgi:cysteine synthase